MSHPLRLFLAFAAVYLLWGSTYLAIRIGVETLPPMLFAGSRFLLAAVLVMAYVLLRGERLPSDPRHWRTIIVTACMMLVAGNGLVTWSEQWVESNQAALIVATSALWMAWFGSWGGQGERPNALTVAGLVLGFVGVAVLVGAGLGAHAAPLLTYLALLAASALWAGGSIYSRRRPLPCSPMMTAGLQMWVTGIVMLCLGVALDEPHRWQWDLHGLGALLYLAVFGSCIAYGAYSWLVHQVTPSQLGTYAYVNPAVAVLLGWWILDEHLSASQTVGTLIILAAVVLVTWASRPRRALNGFK